jgi:hypothetical protein
MAIASRPSWTQASAPEMILCPTNRGFKMLAARPNRSSYLKRCERSSKRLQGVRRSNEAHFRPEATDRMRAGCDIQSRPIDDGRPRFQLSRCRGAFPAYNVTIGLPSR